MIGIAVTIDLIILLTVFSTVLLSLWLSLRVNVFSKLYFILIPLILTVLTDIQQFLVNPKPEWLEIIDLS